MKEYTLMVEFAVGLFATEDDLEAVRRRVEERVIEIVRGGDISNYIFIEELKLDES